MHELIQRLDLEPNFPEIQKEVLALVQAHPDCSQISLQTRPKYPDWQDGVGTLPRHLSEADYNYLNPQLLGSALAKYIHSLGSRARRTRIMVMQPGAGYSLHRDPNPRWHLPIVTNAGAEFLFPTHNLRAHLELGRLYLVDTKELHTAKNSGRDVRIHLVTAQIQDD